MSFIWSICLHFLALSNTRSSIGNKFLGDNKLGNKLLEEPDRCAAVVGLAINIINLVANVLSPFTPGISEGLQSQLNVMASAHIPDTFDATTIKAGHKIGTPGSLFSVILPAKIDEWREAFGGDEVRKAKAEAAAVAAAKKAAKEKKKLKKQQKDTGAAAPASVEHAEKQDIADPKVAQLADSLAKTEVHTS